MTDSLREAAVAGETSAFAWPDADARRAPSVHRRAAASWPVPLVESGVLFLLAFTPLAYGTVEPWSEALAELVVLGLATLWMLGMVMGSAVRVELPPGWLPASLFLALVLVQSVPLPVGLIALVSPWIAEAHRGAGSGAAFVPLSLDAYATRHEGVKLLAVAALFLVVYNTYRRAAQTRRAVWTMVLMGVAISLFGIVQRAAWGGRLYWIGPQAPGAGAFGPFVNRAHFAGLMVVVVPVALALFLDGRQEPTRHRLNVKWADRIWHWSTGAAGYRRLVPFFILVMGAAALLSGSRGGAVSLLAALLAMVALSLGSRSGARWAMQVAIAMALIILAAVWIGGDVLYGRFEQLTVEVARPEESSRVRIWTDALDLWKAAPALGTGYASFAAVFPGVRTFSAPFVFIHAESDWVQLLTDTGVVGLGLVLATGVTIFTALLRRYRRPPIPWAGTLAVAAAVAVVGTAIQGVGNFNLVIMSNLIYLAVAVAVALGTVDASPPAAVSGPTGGKDAVSRRGRRARRS